MTEPAPIYETAVEVEIDEDALAIAAEMVGGVNPNMVTRWIRDALNGIIPYHAGTMQHSAWLAYRTAVKAFEISRRPQEATAQGPQSHRLA